MRAYTNQWLSEIWNSPISDGFPRDADAVARMHGYKNCADEAEHVMEAIRKSLAEKP